MTTPLLTTKLYIPPPRPNLVPRPRLIEQLDEGLHLGRKLTLIAAPAGFGKTTLLSEWVAGCGEKVAWLSLDEHDNDPARFWTYVCTSVCQTLTEIGETSQAMLVAAPQTAIETVLTTLINELAAQSSQIVLVLDDYQMINAQPIHDGLAFLLDYLPPQMHLVIVTREAPPLPLARLRARGSMTEIGGRDLRFSSEETTTFLNRRMGLDLTADEIAALEARTEGWIASLQLAALALQGLALQGTLSLQRRDDVATFIQAFTGSHHYVLDYLVEEVLSKQSESVQAFVLQTSILKRLTGPLCDAVRGEVLHSQAMLEQLTKSNLFIVPLDDERRWYRYHHLFADLLRARLSEAQPDRVPELHRRASVWYEENGLTVEAVDHALAAEDFERAAYLIEQTAWTTMWGYGAFGTLRRWLQALPTDLVLSQPKLCLANAWLIWTTGQPEIVERFLESSTARLQKHKDGLNGQVSTTPLQATTITVRALVARDLGDLSLANKLFQEALALWPDDEMFLRATVSTGLATTYHFKGVIANAVVSYEQAADLARKGNNVYAFLVSMGRLGQVHILQSRLYQAVDDCQKIWQFVEEQGLPPLPAVGYADIIMGDVMRERNELDAAAHHLRAGIEHGERGEHAVILLQGYPILARVLQAQGDMAGALDAIDKAKEIWQRHHAPRFWGVPPVAACEARLWLRRGDVAPALRWMRESEISADEELNFLHEFEHLTLARVLTAQKRFDAALDLLARLQKAAEAGERMGRVIETLLLQAVAFQLQGDNSRAMPLLRQALSLAAPEGYVRIFADEGKPMAELLQQAVTQEIAVDAQPGYIDRILMAIELESLGFQVAGKKSTAMPPSRGQHFPEALIDSLTERELEVLRLIAAGLSNHEIARELTIAASTAKRHVSNIYIKLDVHSRTQAVAKARALRLL